MYLGKVPCFAMRGRETGTTTDPESAESHALTNDLNALIESCDDIEGGQFAKATARELRDHADNLDTVGGNPLEQVDSAESSRR